MSEPETGGIARPRPARPLIALFTSHWLAMVGLGLVLTAIVMWLSLLPAQLRHGQDNPYVGLVTTAIGGVLVLGAVLAPIGLYFGRRRLQQRMVALHGGKTPWFRLLAFLAATSALNLVIASQMTLRVVHHLESKQFCLSCHVHMPEERSFDQGPHAGILCVDCHVGNGTLGLIESKLRPSSRRARP